MRPAIEVWRSAYEAWCDPPPHLVFSEAAAAIIEADRAELVAEIVAWLREEDGHGYDDMRADIIEAKFGADNGQRHGD